MRANRSIPMPVKYWSFAGLMITTRCNAACECCYLNCSPTSNGPEMTVERAIELWGQLVSTSPHGCRIHLSGGEPFLDWPKLIKICRRAKSLDLAPLEKVETNAFWATNRRTVVDRVRELDQAGMGKLAISADPYHQQFVPIERCRLAASVAEEILGPQRVQVRWKDWLGEGFDTDRLDDSRRRALYVQYAGRGRDRFIGRQAEFGPAVLFMKGPANVDTPCREALLRSRHVHIDGGGAIMPGTCAGLILGIAGNKTVSEIWSQLVHAESRRILGELIKIGPTGLAKMAQAEGFVPRMYYASKCQLCWEARVFLHAKGIGRDELGPDWIYA